jgi:hypothetical protein
MANGDLIIVMATINADLTERLQAAVIAPDGRQTLTPLAERGYGGTARFDHVSNSLVLTTMTSDGFHTLSRVSLAGGGAQPLVSPQLTGITFGALAVLPDGAIMFSREEANSDLWLIDVHNK